MASWRYLTVVAAALLAGCNALQAPSETVAESESSNAVMESVEQPLGTEYAEAVLTTETPLQETQLSDTDSAISRLLRDAESALAVDQLTTPVHDNAFDRFQAVLLLSPDNAQALSGIDQIFLRYLQMAQQAASANQFKQARELLQRAESVNSDHPQLNIVEEEITSKQRAYAARHVEVEAGPPVVVSDKEVRIDGRALARKDDVVVSQLQRLAQKVRETQETLLIVARSDAEGRWIYKIMNEAVPGYRLRGDIKVERVPRVLLLPPID